MLVYSPHYSFPYCPSLPCFLFTCSPPISFPFLSLWPSYQVIEKGPVVGDDAKSSRELVNQVIKHCHTRLKGPAAKSTNDFVFGNKRGENHLFNVSTVNMGSSLTSLAS